MKIEGEKTKSVNKFGYNNKSNQYHKQDKRSFVELTFVLKLIIYKP